MDYTLGQIRPLINPQSFPSTINGGNVTVAQQNALINRVREAWYYTPSDADSGAIWLGTRSPQVLPITRQPIPPNAPGNCLLQTITMPIGFGKIQEANDGFGSLDVRNQWFRYTQTPPLGGSRTLDDLGYGFVGVIDFPYTGSQLTITTTATEVSALTATLFGTDVNGHTITEVMAIPTTSGQSVTSVNTYFPFGNSGGLTQVILSVTAGNLLATQTVGGIFFALYRPGQVSPNFRRYLLNTGYQNPNYTSINTICIRKYYPLIFDTDPCEFGSILAFEVGLRAYQYMLNMDMDHYRSALAESIGYLNGEEAASMSESDEGIVRMEFSTSGGSVQNII